MNTIRPDSYTDFMHRRHERKSRKANPWLPWAVVLAMMLLFVWLGYAVGADKQERPELRLGTPTCIEAWHPSYGRGHCFGHFTSYWVEFLSPDLLDGPGDRKHSKFHADPDVPVEFRATLADYAGSHDDRGHGPCAANAHRSQAAMDDTHLLSAMMPQTPELNRGEWAKLEQHIRDYVADGWCATIYTMPCFVPDDEGVIHIKTIGEHWLYVPTHCGKAVLFEKNEQRFMRAWLMPNDDSGVAFEDCPVTVDRLEFVSGLDFFQGLPDDAEDAMEAKEP